MLWHERLKRHCQPVKTDMPYQATICQHHLEWIGKKVQIQQLHKLAIFLWPKFNLLRMFCETERDAILQDAKSWIASYRATGGNVTEEQNEPDMLSRNNVSSEEWMLHPLAVQRIWEILGKARVDLFASKNNSHCPIFFQGARMPWPTNSPAFRSMLSPQSLCYRRYSGESRCNGTS